MEHKNKMIQNCSDEKTTSNFAFLYKARPSKEESQENRRHKLLEEQRKNRNSSQDSRRILDTIILNSEEEEISKNKDANDNRRKNSQHRRTNTLSNQLMLSEWMEEIPINIENDWLMVFCPTGMRTLVIAHRGRTRAYTKRGHFLYEFPSALPGGSHWNNLEQNRKNSCTILDCIYSEPNESFYVLDVLAWGNQPFLACQAEFRFFWLNGKLSEYKQISQKDLKFNPYPFILLPKHTCEENSLSTALSQWPAFINDDPCLDGLLFFHKDAIYTPGSSPTVLWLLPFMVPEVISPRIKVHDTLMSKRPVDYLNQKSFIQKFYEERKQRRTHKKHNSNVCDMEIQNVDVSSNSESILNDLNCDTMET